MVKGTEKSTKVLPLPTFPTTWLLFPSQAILHCQSDFEWRHKTKRRRCDPNSPGKKKRRTTREKDKDRGIIKTEERGSQQWQASEQHREKDDSRTDEASVKQTLMQYGNKSSFNTFRKGSIMWFYHALTDWHWCSWLVVISCNRWHFGWNRNQHFDAGSFATQANRRNI